MALNDWADGVLGNTPLTAARLNERDGLISAALVQFAADPSLMFSGTVTNDANGAPISAAVKWPDGATGVYSGTPSTTWPGAINSYTITKVGVPTKTYTQPAVTRDGNGYVTNRPPMTVS